jgi:hypothetical protein
MDNLKLGFGVALFVVFSLAAYTSMGFHRLAMYFPFAVSVLGVVLSGAYVGKLLFARIRGGTEISVHAATDTVLDGTMEVPDAVSEIRKALPYLAWFIGYILLIALAGIVVASALFLAAFLYREARMRWWGVLISVVSTLVVLYTFSGVMRLYWPRNLFGL